MAKLTLAEIDALLAAYETELEAAELGALKEWLVMRSAEPNAQVKLQLAVYSLPETQRQNADQFVAESQAVTAGVMRRGIAEIDAMTDDEWEWMLNGE
jgi:hypothetical protein